MQKALGSKLPIPVMFLCPPWVLAMLAPLGLVHSYAIGWSLWFAILVVCVAIGSKLLMDTYFGDLEIPEISSPRGYRYLIAFTFYPALYALKCTQLSPLVFFGIAGFLYWWNRQRKVVAGLFLCLTLVKPHLVFMLWLAILLRREWTLLITSGSVVALLSAIVVFRFPPAFHEYLGLMSGAYPRIVASGVFGGIRTLWSSPNNYWIQFVPTILGVLWLVVYWRRFKKKWNWTEQTPILITTSLLCTPYGFTHDQTLLMVPIICLAADIARQLGRISLNWVLLYSAVNFSVLAILFFSDQWAFVPAPIVVAFILATRGRWFEEVRFA